ncbi:MAG TPA: hypothetical protein VEU31_07660 [Candidatus Acidoferrales bacterium]|nr:hypothetical protein [Candidatus Acidoferrales bacterium]
MFKRTAGLVAAVLLIFCVPAALPQMERGQTVYTYVSQFQVPRANWAQFADDTEKTTNPILQKALADGVIISWGDFESIVHTPDGYTNGSWWQATSLNGITRVLDELRKAGPRPPQVASTRHEDFLLRTIERHAAPQSGASGYLRVRTTLTQPGKGGDMVAHIQKYIWPVLEDQLKKGNVTYYAADEQYVLTAPGSLRHFVTFYPSAEALDKAVAAVTARLAGMSADERKAWQDGLSSASVPDSTRDMLARITHYAQK